MNEEREGEEGVEPAEERAASPGPATARGGPRRPLLGLAAVLATGSWLGLEWAARGGPDGRPTPSPLAGWLFAAAVCGGFLLLRIMIGRRPRGSPAGPRGGGWPPLWSVGLLVLAFVRGAGAPQPPPAPPPEATPAPWVAAREEVLVGRWHPWPSARSRRGWLEPPASAEGPSAAGLLFETEGPPPAPGTWIAVHPGEPPVPWPTGPEPGPLAKGGRFQALAKLLPDEWARLTPPPPGRLSPLFERGRASLRRRLRAAEEEGALRGLLQALVLGDPSALEHGVVDLFTRTGTRHLLAVSGLHVGLVAALFVLPLARGLGRGLGRRWPGRVRLLALLLPCPLLVAYAGLAGAAPPIVRASLAVCLGLLAPLFLRRGDGRPPRRPDALSLWALALSCECLAAPTAVTSVPVRLSYLATLGILVGTRPLTQLLRRRPAGESDGRRDALRSPLALGWRIPFRRLRGAVATALAASVAAVLATLPEIWSVFGEVSPLGVVATPLALLPLVPLLLGGWGVALAPGVVDPTWLLPCAKVLLGLLGAIDRLPGTPTPLPPRPAALLWLTTLATFAALHLRSARPGKRAGSLIRRLAALGGAALLVPWSAAPRGFELHVLDVGHGSCAVARAPGLPALVFDGGSHDRRRVCQEALFPLLRRWDVVRPVVALSHDHADHRSALDRLVERFPPRLWIGARPAHLVERLPHALPVVDPSPGRVRVAVGGLPESVAIHVIRGTSLEGNEGSRSLELTLGRHRVLLMGDAEAEGLAATLERGLLRRPARLLVFPHHGSDTPHLRRLLDHVSPTEVWISASSPPAVGRELDRLRQPWAWTGREGHMALFLPSGDLGIGGGAPLDSPEPRALPNSLRRPRFPSPDRPTQRDEQGDPRNRATNPPVPSSRYWRERDESARVDSPAAAEAAPFPGPPRPDRPRLEHVGGSGHRPGAPAGDPLPPRHPGDTPAGGGARP